MRKFFRAIIIGYAVLWVAEYFRKGEVNSLEEIKDLLRKRL
jgi:hypothetical protein